MRFESGSAPPAPGPMFPAAEAAPRERRGWALALAIATLAGCSHSATGSAGTQAAFDSAAVAASVDSAVRAFMAAELARDADAATAHFLRDADFRVHSDLDRFEYDSARAVVARTLPALRSVEGGFDTVEVMVIGPAAALATTPFHETLTDSAGKATRLRGLTTWLWQRVGDDWKVRYIHAAHYPDPAPAPAGR